MHIKLVFTILILISSCITKDEIEKPDSNAISILFIGNSLTYSNNLPDLVQKEALKRSIQLNTETIAKPNYAIIDHWDEGFIQKRILTKQFDFVVFQQGPSSQQDGYDMLLEYGLKLSSLCKQNSSTLAYYMVWPAIQHWYTFDGVIANYTNAAEETGSLLCPVGKVWKEYIEAEQDYSLYSTDSFHPSLKGSELAAKVIVDHLFPNSIPVIK